MSAANNAGLCWAHRSRLRRYGSFDLPKKKSLFEMFAESVEVDEPDKCWLWTGNVLTTGLGYGRVNVNRKSYLAHRLSYEFLNGELPKDKLVLHHCDNARCVNPHHLYAGTHQNNAVDRASRKPNSFAHGEKSGHAKLTDDQVISIRQDSRSCYAIAKQYGVSPGLISMVKNRKVWKHLGA
jgi:hypothetical protein